MKIAWKKTLKATLALALAISMLFGMVSIIASSTDQGYPNNTEPMIEETGEPSNDKETAG